MRPALAAPVPSGVACRSLNIESRHRVPTLLQGYETLFGPMTTHSSNGRISIMADTIVEDHTAVAMAVSLIPIPLAEFAALTAVHLKMVEKLAELYRVEFSPHRAKTIIASLVTGYFSTCLGLLAVNRLAKLLPGLGTVVNLATLPAVAGTVTFAMGKMFVLHFESGGALSDLDPKVAQAAFARQVAKKPAQAGAIAPTT